MSWTQAASEHEGLCEKEAIADRVVSATESQVHLANFYWLLGTAGLLRQHRPNRPHRQSRGFGLLGL
jgi:hypothetical protein